MVEPPRSALRRDPTVFAAAGRRVVTDSLAAVVFDESAPAGVPHAASAALQSLLGGSPPPDGCLRTAASSMLRLLETGPLPPAPCGACDDSGEQPCAHCDGTGYFRCRRVGCSRNHGCDVCPGGTGRHRCGNCGGRETWVGRVDPFGFYVPREHARLLLWWLRRQGDASVSLWVETDAALFQLRGLAAETGRSTLVAACGAERLVIGSASPEGCRVQRFGAPLVGAKGGQ